jgi:hypothetical protein
MVADVHVVSAVHGKGGLVTGPASKPCHFPGVAPLGSEMAGTVVAAAKLGAKAAGRRKGWRQVVSLFPSGLWQMDVSAPNAMTAPRGDSLVFAIRARFSCRAPAD